MTPGALKMLLASALLGLVSESQAHRGLRRTTSLRKIEHHASGLFDYGLGVYVPYKLPGVDGLMYFNSRTDQCSFASPPAGSQVAHMAAPFQGPAMLLAGKRVSGKATAPEDESVPIFPDESQVNRTSCKPHCTYKCDKPVCEADCKPKCKPPLCKADCEKTDYDKCKVECGKPNCAVYCPAGACCDDRDDMCHKNSTKQMNCDSPSCATHCDEPKCVLNCPNNKPLAGCKTTCEKPACEWECKNPTDCPEPKCEMVCETPPDCAKNTSSEVKIYNPKLCDPESDPGCAAAKEGCPKWQYGEWSACQGNCTKGTRTRTVTCPTGNDADCSCKEKESAEEACETGIKPQWECKAWPACPADNCDDVVVERACTCGCSSGECGDEPEMKKTCPARDEEPCKACLTDGGNGTTPKGTVCFSEGEHGCTDFEHEVKKEAGHPEGRIHKLTGLSVTGCFCKARLYEYCDFNEKHEGWDVTFTRGEYSGEQLERVPNDSSAIKVYRERGRKSESHGASRFRLFGFATVGLGLLAQVWLPRAA